MSHTRGDVYVTAMIFLLRHILHVHTLAYTRHTSSHGSIGFRGITLVMVTGYNYTFWLSLQW